MGDEQRFEDPQVTELCSRVAELLGMEAAVFLPSGTMCNEIAFRLHIRPGGDEVILHRTLAPDHRRGRRAGRVRGGDDAAARHAARDVHGRRRARRAAPRRAATAPRSRLVSVEQTTNMAGGRVWPLEQLRGVVDVAHEHGLRLHMDGARLMNAVVASGVPAAEFTRGLRHRVAGLHEGPRRTAWSVPRGLGGADRGGLALQADARRRAAPGRDRRRGRAVRARPPRRPAGRRPRERAHAGDRAGVAARHHARPGRGRDEHRDLRGRRPRRPVLRFAARRRA